MLRGTFVFVKRLDINLYWASGARSKKTSPSSPVVIGLLGRLGSRFSLIPYRSIHPHPLLPFQGRLHHQLPVQQYHACDRDYYQPDSKQRIVCWTAIDTAGVLLGCYPKIVQGQEES